MSVSISPELNEIGLRVLCGFDAGVYQHDQLPDHPLVGGCDEAKAFLASIDEIGFDETFELLGTPAAYGHFDPEVCTRWTGDQVWTSPVWADEPGVHLSNMNARLIMDLLGLGTEHLCGSLDAEDFLGRVLVAQGCSVGDPGRPAEMSRGTSGATVIDCGREAGYSEKKLELLREVAEFARARGVPVTWG